MYAQKIVSESKADTYCDTMEECLWINLSAKDRIIFDSLKKKYDKLQNDNMIEKIIKDMSFQLKKKKISKEIFDVLFSTYKNTNDGWYKEKKLQWYNIQLLESKKWYYHKITIYNNSKERKKLLWRLQCGLRQEGEMAPLIFDIALDHFIDWYSSLSVFSSPDQSQLLLGDSHQWQAWYCFYYSKNDKDPDWNWGFWFFNKVPEHKTHQWIEYSELSIESITLEKVNITEQEKKIQSVWWNMKKEIPIFQKKCSYTYAFTIKNIWSWSAIFDQYNKVNIDGQVITLPVSILNPGESTVYRFTTIENELSDKQSSQCWWYNKYDNLWRWFGSLYYQLSNGSQKYTGYTPSKPLSLLSIELIWSWWTWNTTYNSYKIIFKSDKPISFDNNQQYFFIEERSEKFKIKLETKNIEKDKEVLWFVQIPTIRYTWPSIPGHHWELIETACLPSYSYSKTPTYKENDDSCLARVWYVDQKTKKVIYSSLVNSKGLTK